MKRERDREREELGSVFRLLTQTTLVTDPCRYGSNRWRRLCPFVHVCGRTHAPKCAELFAWLTSVEDADEEHIADVPVPQIAAKILEVIETVFQESIWCMFEEPQVAAKIFEVIKVPQDAPVPHVELTRSLGEAGSSWPVETRPAPTLPQSQGLLVKLGLLGKRSTAARQNPNSKCFLVKVNLDLLGAKQTARPVPPP